MRKIDKNCKGFTLIEMVLVIAIIVILAAVMIISVSGYLARASMAKDEVKSHNASLDSASAVIDDNAS